MNLRKELQSLLSEDLASAQKRAQVYLDERLPDGRPVALFGAGNIGKETARRLVKTGIRPVAFIDDTPEKKGTLVEGIPVMPATDAIKAYGKDLSVVVTILNPAHDFAKTEQRFCDLFGILPISFMGLAWKWPDVFKGMHGVTHPVATLEKGNQILTFFDLLEDDASKQVYLDELKFRLILDFSVLPPKEEPAYFPHSLSLGLKKPFIFVDAGAYDGDTVMALCDYADPSKIEKIIAFEPDPKNFSKLEKVCASKGLTDISQCYQAALGGKPGTLRFNATGDMSAALSSYGAIEVPVKTLMDTLPQADNIYIKFDIEGAEEEAITAAHPFMKKHRPTMAISVYHKPEDLWNIGLELNALQVGYKFFMRNHGVDGTDVICYAIPG